MQEQPFVTQRRLASLMSQYRAACGAPGELPSALEAASRRDTEVTPVAHATGDSRAAQQTADLAPPVAQGSGHHAQAARRTWSDAYLELLRLSRPWPWRVTALVVALVLVSVVLWYSPQPRSAERAVLEGSLPSTGVVKPADEKPTPRVEPTALPPTPERVTETEVIAPIASPPEVPPISPESAAAPNKRARGSRSIAAKRANRSEPPSAEPARRATQSGASVSTDDF